MNEIIECIKNNVTWIQSLMSIILTTIATIIGILTYKRAKMTLLQPVRSEVVKNQSKLLMDLLSFTKEEVDYLSLLRINVFYYLNEYGFKLKDKDKIIEYVEENKIGSIIVSDSNKLDSVEVLETFTEDLKDEEIEKNKKEKYENGKKGIIHIEQIYYDKKFYEYNKRLRSFIDNPFMPRKFIDILKEMNKQINYNSSTALKETLEKFLVEYIERYNKGKTNFNMYGLYNSYHRRFINSNECIIKLREETRQYLYVDYEWK